VRAIDWTCSGPQVRVPTLERRDLGTQKARLPKDRAKAGETLATDRFGLLLYDQIIFDLFDPRDGFRDDFGAILLRIRIDEAAQLNDASEAFDLHVAGAHQLVGDEGGLHPGGERSVVDVLSRAFAGGGGRATADGGDSDARTEEDRKKCG